MQEEVSINIPWYIDLHWLAKHHFSVNGSEAVISKLKELGYQASRTHFSPVGIRTSANINDLSNIFGKE